MTFSDPTEFEDLKTEDAKSPVRSADSGAEQDSPDSDKEFEIEVAKAGGVSTLIASAVFNDAALPRGFMQRYSELITFANRAAGDLSIGNGAGPVDQKTKQERDEEANDKALDAMQDMAEEVERQRQEDREAWDAKMSSDVPGMTQGEVLHLLKTINANPQKYLNLAVQKGIIKEEDKDEFGEYLKVWQRNEEYKRDHKGEGDPALQAQLDANSDFKVAVPKLEQVASQLEAKGIAATRPDQLVARTNADSGANDYAANYYEADTVDPQASQARDPAFVSAPELSEHFETAASNNPIPATPLPPAPKPAIVVAVTNSNDAMM